MDFNVALSAADGDLVSPALSFTRHRLDCAAIMRGALKAPGLNDLDKAHANALHSLSMIKLHKIVGQPDAADFLAVRDDLMEVAGIIDKLILAIGDEAKSSSHKIELSLFEDQVKSVVMGDAAFNLEEAAEEIEEELAREGISVREDAA